MRHIKISFEKGILILITLILNSLNVVAQIPVEKYRNEILNLKSEEAIKDYWSEIYAIDQDTLLNLPVTNITVYDSLSISNMIRTALMFEIHKSKAHTINNITPTMNQAHNYLARASLPLWSIINERLALGNEGDVLSSKNLAYELENVSLPFYDYSMLNKEKMYPQLVEKLNKLPNDSIIDRLNSIYENQKELRKLETVEVIGSWFIQPFKNTVEERCFEFIKLSNGIIYSRKGEYLKKLLLITISKNAKTYKVEGEPFGWFYELYHDNSLKLYNNNHEVLIAYSACK